MTKIDFKNKNKSKKLKRNTKKGGGIWDRLTKKTVGFGKSGSKWWQRAYKTAKGRGSQKAKLGKNTINFISSADGKKTVTKFKLDDLQKSELAKFKTQGRKGRQGMKDYLSELQSDFGKNKLKGASKLSETTYGSKKFLGSIRGRGKRASTTFGKDGKILKMKTKGNDGLISTTKFKYNDTGKLLSKNRKIQDKSTFMGRKFGKGSRSIKTKYEDGVVKSVSRSRGIGRGVEKTNFRYKRDDSGKIITGIDGKPTLVRTQIRTGKFIPSKSTYTKIDRTIADAKLNHFKKPDGTINWDSVNKSTTLSKHQKKEYKKLYNMKNPNSYGDNILKDSKTFKKKSSNINSLKQKEIKKQTDIKTKQKTQTQIEANQQTQTQIEANQQTQTQIEANQQTTLSDFLQNRSSLQSQPNVVETLLSRGNTSV